MVERQLSNLSDVGSTPTVSTNCLPMGGFLFSELSSTNLNQRKNMKAHPAEVMVLCASVSPQGIPLTTYQLRYWRGIHS